jgi:hypothetical protein
MNHFVGWLSLHLYKGRVREFTVAKGNKKAHKKTVKCKEEEGKMLAGL